MEHPPDKPPFEFNWSALRFSPLGLRLFTFWLCAAVLFGAAWAWKPHEEGRVNPFPLGPSPLSTSLLDEPPRPERTGFSKLIHDRLLDRDDSWTACKIALKRIHEHPNEPLYDPVFDMGVKFQYPPSALLPFEVLSRLGAWATRNPVLNSLSVAFFGLFAFLTHRLAQSALGAPQRALLDHAVPYLFVAFYYPLLKGLEIGQIQTWLTCGVVLSLLWYARGHSVAAGVLLGISCTIKPQMGLFLVWALFQKEYALAKSMTAVVAVIGLLSLLVYGWDVHVEYLHVLSSISRHGESYFANQSVNGLLLRALHLGHNLAFSMGQFAPYHPLVRYGTLLSSLALIAFAMWPRGKWEFDGESALFRALHFGLAALCFTMASPIAWEHHYGLGPALFALCLVALFRWQSAGAPHERAPKGYWIALGAGWLLLATRISAAGALADTSLNFVQSHFFFGGLCLLALLYLSLRSRRGVPGAL